MKNGVLILIDISIDFMKRACKVTVLKRLQVLELQHGKGGSFRKGPPDTAGQEVRTEKGCQSTTQRAPGGATGTWNTLSDGAASSALREAAEMVL